MPLDKNSYQPVFHANQEVRNIGLIPSLESPKLSGFVVGEHVSRNRGRGKERNSTREYQFGDNIKDIDWKLSARQADGSSLVVRTYFDEVTPDMYFVSDVFKDRTRVNQGHFSKSDLGASIIACLIKTANQQEYPTSLFAARDDALYVQPRPSNGGLSRIYHDIAQLSSSTNGQYDLALGKIEEAPDQDITLSRLINRVGQLATRSIIFVVSDFRGDNFLPSDDNGWQESLEDLRSLNNTLIAIELTQPGDFQLHDHTETFQSRAGIVRIGSNPRDRIGQKIRRNYSKAAKVKQNAIDEALSETTDAHIKLSTENGLWLTSLRDQIMNKLRSK